MRRIATTRTHVHTHTHTHKHSKKFSTRVRGSGISEWWELSAVRDMLVHLTSRSVLPGKRRRAKIVTTIEAAGDVSSQPPMCVYVYVYVCVCARSLLLCMCMHARTARACVCVYACEKFYYYPVILSKKICNSALISF